MRGKDRARLWRSVSRSSKGSEPNRPRAGTVESLAMTLEIGQPAPAFTLRDKAFQEVTRDSYEGKHLVLAFYPMAFTGG